MLEFLAENEALQDAPEYSHEEIQELVRLRELKRNLARLAEIKKLNGLAFYQPHPKQDKFHSAGGKKRRYVRTGNRWGKSTAGIAEDLSWCLGERIFYPQGDPRRSVGIPETSVKGVLIVQDWDKAEEIFTAREEGQGMGKIFQLLPRDSEVGVEKSQSGHIYKILIKSKWGGTSSLYIDTVKSFKQNPMGHESSDWDFVHVDEPLPEEMWAAYSRGLIDRGGKAWFLCTPLTEIWINDYFIPDGRARQDFGDGTAFEEEKRKDFWVMTGSSHDNPTLTKESISDFARDVPKNELEARLYGRPRQLSGVIHKEFDRELHVYKDTPHGWRSMCDPPDNWTIRFAIDPHPKLPMAVLFAATGPLGHTYFWAEIFQTIYIPALCDSIHSLLKVFRNGQEKEREVALALCDPIAWTPNPNNGKTWADEFYDNEIMIHPGSKAMMEGILKTGELLRRRDNYGNPMLMFSEDLLQTIKEFDRYVWNPKLEKPQENNFDHMMENLHRLCIAGLDWIDPNESLRPIKPLEMDRMNFRLPKYTPEIPGMSKNSHKKRPDFGTRYRC